MAPQNPSTFLQSRTDHTAQGFRMAFAAFDAFIAKNATSPRGGVHPNFGNLFNVTGNAAMTVNVDTGLVLIPGTNAFQGLYVGYNNASYVVTVPASDPTNYRTDLIVARQFDTAYGDASSQWDIVDVTGTLSATSPAPAPALPATSVLIATLSVNPGITQMNGAGLITMAQTWWGGSGVVPQIVGGAPTPASMVDGTSWVDPNVHKLGVVLNGVNRYVRTSPNTGTDWDGPIGAYRTSLVTIASNTTLAADSQLTVPVQPNAVYEIKAVINYESSGLPGLKFDFSMPTNAAMAYYYTSIPYGATTTQILYGTSGSNGLITGLGPFACATPTGVNASLDIRGTLVTGANGGSLTFLEAQNFSTVNALIIGPYSNLVATRIA